MKTCRKGLHQYLKIQKQCPECKMQSREQWCKDNTNKIKIYTSQWYLDNLNKPKAKIKNAQYYKNNSEKLKIKSAQWRKNQIKINLLFKTRCDLRSLINKSIKRQGFSKDSKTFQLLGCTLEEAQNHLIDTAIERYSSYDPNFKYHIDHIVPCSSAKTKEELIKLQYYTNLQYLTPEDNMRKSDSWDGTVDNESWNQ
jgi:hypothetical protein